MPTSGSSATIDSQREQKIAARHTPIHLSDPHTKEDWDQCTYCCKSPCEGWPCDARYLLTELEAAKREIVSLNEDLAFIKHAAGVMGA